jgi:hypothetical protein|eukprot:COSAG01_NODE_4428_length_5032_cov_11.671666_4_plen_91_part_00
MSEAARLVRERADMARQAAERARSERVRCVCALVEVIARALPLYLRCQGGRRRPWRVGWGGGQEAVDAFLWAAVLSEIYLCGVCSGQEIK